MLAELGLHCSVAFSSGCSAKPHHCGSLSRAAWAPGARTSVVAHELSSHGSRLSSADSVVVAHRLSCSKACRIFLHAGIEPVFPALTVEFLTSGPPGKPCAPFDHSMCWDLTFCSWYEEVM